MFKKFVYYGFSILAGFLIIAFIFLGNNVELFSENSLLNWIIIIGLSFSFYYLIIRSIQNIYHIYLGAIGVFIAKLSIPFLVILFKIITTNNQSEKRIIQKRDNKILNINYCENNKYGYFVSREDTLIRFEKDNRNFEEIRTFNGIRNVEIMWVDTCSYIRINGESRIGEELVKIVNINDSISEMIVKNLDSRIVVKEKLNTYHQKLK